MDANIFYPSAKGLFLGFVDRQLNWMRDTFLAVLCNEQYDADPDKQFLADIRPELTFVSQPLELRGKGISANHGTAAAVTFNLEAGKRLEYVLIYHDTGDPATSELVILQKLSKDFPLISDGTPFTVRWNKGIITL